MRISILIERMFNRTTSAQLILTTTIFTLVIVTLSTVVCVPASSARLSVTLLLTKQKQLTGKAKHQRRAVTSPSKKKLQRNRRTYRPQRRIKSTSINSQTAAIRSVTIVRDSLLVPGIIYRMLDVTLADSAHAIVHAVTCVVRNPRYSIDLVPSRDRIGGLESVPAIAMRLDTTFNRDVLVAINASFWRAGTNIPIGVTVCGGEIVSNRAAQWYTLWLDRRYRPWFDSSYIETKLILSNGTAYPIEAINCNATSDTLVMYNRWAGDSIPIRSFMLDSMNMTVDAGLIVQLDTLDPVPTPRERSTIVATEYRNWYAHLCRRKILLRYLRPPAINSTTPCLVLAVRDSGAVEVPLRGCIVSLPSHHPLATAINAGDTVLLSTRTRMNDSIEFHVAVSGSPLLLRQGAIKPHLEDTTKRGSPFIEQRLARTAVGTDAIQSVLYLIAVEKLPNKSVGMSLRELAQFLRRFGAYEAINFDGGGSTTMVVGRTCVVPADVQRYRPVANSIVVWRRKVSSR
ncbi:MAG: phosphodiester glycosidase family protein [Chlorobi bacterium]|nr:phosphodiester glycosidase family protein [Chlorobiota bacterium]